MLNNARARKCRQKKKEYYTELEGKVEELEQTISEQKTLIAELNQKILYFEIEAKDNKSSNTQNDDIMRDCQSILSQIPNDMVKQKVTELNAKFGPFGPERQSIIDNSFRTIIENLCPDEYKQLFKHTGEKINKRKRKREPEPGECKFLDYI